MTPDQVAIIIGAIVTLIGAITAAAVTIINALHGNRTVVTNAATDAATAADVQNAKLDSIHVLVNSRLTTALTQLATAVEYITELSQQLQARGITPAIPAVIQPLLKDPPTLPVVEPPIK